MLLSDLGWNKDYTLYDFKLAVMSMQSWGRCMFVLVHLFCTRAYTLCQGLTCVSVWENQISLKLLHLLYDSMRKTDSHIWMLQESLREWIPVIPVKSKALFVGISFTHVFWERIQ